MPDLAEPAVCRFDDFLLDRQAGTLTRLRPDGEQTSVEIGSRALQILCLLVDRGGEIVSQRELMDAVWPNVAVEPNNLTVQLSALRRVLDADRKQGSCIRNIPGRGYRFMAMVTETSRPLRDVAAEARTEDHTRPAAGPPCPPVGTGRGQVAWFGTLSLILVAVLACGVWYLNRAPSSPVETATMPAERPWASLVVLPFSNLGGDGLADDIVYAITDDLITDLLRWPDVTVIARNSAFAYKGKSIDIRRVGEELGVRYAVEGSVRNVDGTLRVNVQLVSAETGAHIWGERFEVTRDAIGHGDDDTLRLIAMVVNWRVVDAEAERSLRERPANPDVADLLVRARSIYARPPTPQRQVELVSLYEQALAFEPNSATALAGLAEALLDSIHPFEDPTAPEKIRRAEELLGRAERLRPGDAAVMWVRVYLLGAQDRCAEVIPAAQRAVDAYPILTSPRQWLGICLIRVGSSAEAIPALEQAIRINPRNVNNTTRFRVIGYAHLFIERYDESVEWFRRSLAANPGDSAAARGGIYAAIAAAQALAGRLAEARVSAAEANRLNPALTARGHFPFEIRGATELAQVARMRDGLRLAGMRDHADEDADFGLASDSALHTDYAAPTPNAAPGARTIRTPEMARLMEQRKPLILDTVGFGRSVPGAVNLCGAGIGGSVAGELQDRLARKMRQLTGGDPSTPIVTMGFNAERYQGRNLALRLAALGYTEIYWYRGGREAWQVANLPDAELTMQDW
jgi:TolB-like protein/DNA-binding winged helix-turn-helix (wHTH) protein/tetratricopeptide (TPR) repeat protein